MRTSKGSLRTVQSKLSKAQVAYLKANYDNYASNGALWGWDYAWWAESVIREAVFCGVLPKEGV